MECVLGQQIKVVVVRTTKERFMPFTKAFKQLLLGT